MSLQTQYNDINIFSLLVNFYSKDQFIAPVIQIQTVKGILENLYNRNKSTRRRTTSLSPTNDIRRITRQSSIVILTGKIEHKSHHTP